LNRVARRAVAVLIGLVLAAAVVLAGLALSTYPRRAGAVRAAGLAGRVTIATDSHGVPAIRASSIADAMFGV